MGKLNFYVLWSLRDAPRQFSSRSNQRSFQVHIPLPLPELLVVFGVGDWPAGRPEVSVEVLVGPEVPAQKIGTLSTQARCVSWEGGWSSDLVSLAASRSRKGFCAKILLTECRQTEDLSSLFSITPPVQSSSLLATEDNVTDLSTTLQQSTVNETKTSTFSQLGDSIFSAEIKVNQIEISEADLGRKARVWPTDQTPECTVISQQKRVRHCSEDQPGRGAAGRASTPKRRRRSQSDSLEAATPQTHTGDREVPECPSRRWSHAMCLADPQTVVLVGGESSEQQVCLDSLWKLQLDDDLWFPISSSEPAPLCARGHTATFDPDTQEVFVYGGPGEGRCSQLHVLSTLTWRWRLVTVGLLDVTAFYKKELFVFGGVEPTPSGENQSCSNALFIFNPEFQLWYRPIVDGHKPLPRFGHSATLLSHKLVIFGGRKTATYLNDLHVLDLGLMEYTAVKCGNMPPLPRGFHAAVPVSDNRILISGGCSAIGALQDLHLFNMNTNMWSSVACPQLCTKPWAGHGILNLGCSELTESEEPRRGADSSIHCTLLVFGGSDCAGSFYNDTIKCKVVIPVDK